MKTEAERLAMAKFIAEGLAPEAPVRPSRKLTMEQARAQVQAKRAEQAAQEESRAADAFGGRMSTGGLSKSAKKVAASRANLAARGDRLGGRPKQFLSDAERQRAGRKRRKAAQK
jgi:hypothetical protein